MQKRAIIQEYNKICAKCTRKCKQRKEVHLISCPRYNPKPVQLEIKLIFPKTPRKKASS
ncbi:MAG TPA: hypothetical protein P5533_00300 [Candidatus Cloacimonadota bacterium]|nr:hypothetical protein [Candidatus Cloacimonadota bacterium]